MMIDNGLPTGFHRDLLETAGDYIDLAKFKTGTSRLYRQDHLRRKLDAMRRARRQAVHRRPVSRICFAVYGASALEQFYREAQQVGFATIEVSDNVVPLTLQQRRDQIRAAVDSGLEVFGEVGAKDRRSTAAELIEQAGKSFEAGATLVLVEAAELVIDGQPNTAMLDDLTRQLDMARVMIELPGPWIPGVRTCDIEVLKKLLVGTFGPDVNVANVSPDTVIDFEATRTGLGVAGPLGYRAA